MSWVHVSIGSETISSTPEHPYYILNASSNTPIVRFEGKESSSTGCWVAAKDLVTGMKVLLSNGKYDTISSVEIEELETPEVTYNFEVEDLHNYFVGTNGILVHNACGGEDIVGTEHSTLKPTQDHVYRGKVDYYVEQLNAGANVPNIEVYEVPGKGLFIQEGHHRYVASMLTGKPVGITYLNTGGPVGMPNWTGVSWLP